MINNSPIFRTNIYLATLLRLLLVMAIFQLSRFGFYLFNVDSFSSMTIASYLKIAYGGAIFDTTAILYTNVLYIILEFAPLRIRYNSIYRAVVKWLYLLANAIIIVVNSMDYVYFRYTFKRTTALVFDEFENETNMGNIMWQGITDYWYVTLWTIFLVVMLVFGYRAISVKRANPKNLIFYYFRSLLLFLGAMTLFIGGVRGGFAHSTRPITISNATDYITNMGDEAIILNTPFSIYRTFGEAKLVDYKYFDADVLDSLYTPFHGVKDGVDVEEMREKNVVIIIMESFAREYVGALNKDENIDGYRGYTPFLDSLIDHSLSFSHAFANGRKSIEVLPSILSSIPSFTEPLVLSTYSQNSYTSICHLLSNEGYSSRFYHGAPNGSMGFSAFLKKVGCQLYFGKDEYDNDADFDGIWSIWDEPFMQFMADDLSVAPQPFIATLFTTSSHHPFNVPERYEGHFDMGDIPIHQTIGYSDNALRQFFNVAKTMSWYDDTIFVITADHTNRVHYQKYNSPHGQYYVPLIFYTPSGELRGERNQPAQHIDVMPTILDYLNYSKPFFSFGKSILTPSADSDFAISYNNNKYQIIHNEYLLIFDGECSLGLYNYRDDWRLQECLLSTEIELAQMMETKAKAFIQSYNHHLINNEMSVDTLSEVCR